ncbi:MAG: glutamate 5-kinase [Candidatus Omnitrophica bacterium]|nr:glutamate 5-kinase [Candidatus Omnitrophota bacterium]
MTVRACKFTKDNPRLVIKVGSSIISNQRHYLDRARLAELTRQLSQVKQRGLQPVLVSSGAIAAGMRSLQFASRPKDLAQLQACAAVGQSRLMHEYERLFRREKFITAQILLTSDDFQSRARYLNARNTLLQLLENDSIPVVNENDTVVTDEIRFGDNDRLSALVATLIDARLLIILSDVDGLYDRSGAVISQVARVDAAVQSLAGGTRKSTSVGGMVTKLDSAKIVVNAGIPLVIANGRAADVVPRILAGEALGTWFSPSPDALTGRKRWIAFSCRSCGKIIIDEGACAALRQRGTSLLPGGVVAVEGNFSPGDIVIVCDRQGREIARGLTNYAQAELVKIRGSKTKDIETILGYKSYDEVIHRDNLAVAKEE